MNKLELIRNQRDRTVLTKSKAAAVVDICFHGEMVSGLLGEIARKCAA